MSAVEISYDYHWPYSYIRAERFDAKTAMLEYYQDKGKNLWVWENIKSSFPGGGKTVATVFREKIGRGKLVGMNIVEPETRLGLEKAGIFDELMNSKRSAIDLTGGPVFESLKMIRLIKGGNMTPLKVSLVKINIRPESLRRDCDLFRGYPISVSITARS